MSTTIGGAAPTLADIGVAQARILVADPIAEDGVATLRDAGTVDVRTGMTPDQLLDCIADYDALVVRSETKVTAAVLDRATRLRVVGRAGVGVDNVDLEAATRHGVLVLNSPGGNTIAAAEHAVAMMLALARHIPAADASMHQRRWDRKLFMGTELRGKTLAVVGLGKIGFEVARICSQGLRMNVIAADPLATPERARQAGATLVELDQALTGADVITFHVPLTDATRGLVDATMLARMRPHVRLINVARGGIIDEPALADAIRNGHVAGAAIDVYSSEPAAADNPLRELPQVVLTPHLGASTTEAQLTVAADVAEQIVSYLGGGSPRSAVNAPAVSEEELRRLRPYLTLAHRLGLMAAQLVEGGPRHLTVSLGGDLAEAEPELLVAELLRGLLSRVTDARVSLVNARLVARDLGIGVEERRIAADSSGWMEVEVEGDATLRLRGGQVEGRPRLLQIDDFRVDMEPEGTFLVVGHEDKPGVIATVSGALAAQDINIARIELGRDRPRGRAMMLMQIDEPVGDELLSTITRDAGLTRLRLVTL